MNVKEGYRQMLPSHLWQTETAELERVLRISGLQLYLQFQLMEESTCQKQNIPVPIQSQWQEWGGPSLPQQNTS